MRPGEGYVICARAKRASTHGRHRLSSSRLVAGQVSAPVSRRRGARALYRDFTPDDLKPELKACRHRRHDPGAVARQLRRDAALPRSSPSSTISSARWSAGFRSPIPPACAKALDALKPRRKFVGMRHLIVYEKDPRWLLQPTVQESLHRTSPAGLVAFEAITEHRAAAWHGARHRAADAGPRHRAQPSRPSALAGEAAGSRGRRRWCKAAAFPNISVKLSVGGDVVSRWKWSTEQIRRYSDHVHAALRTADRVMAGSNWPVVLLSGSFRRGLARHRRSLRGQLSAPNAPRCWAAPPMRIYRI